MPDLSERLLYPERTVDLGELASMWSDARVSAVIPGHAVLANDVVLLRRIRGALGRELLRSASPEAIAGIACPWQPPCALDVLFREQGRVGARGIPKPFVLAATRRNQDLIVSVTLFGFDVDWAPAVAHALTAVLAHRIAWRDQRPGVFLPPARVGQVTTVGFEGIEPLTVRTEMALEFATPMVDEDGDLLDRPAMILTRLAWRIAALAPWQGVEFVDHEGRLRAEIDGLSCDVTRLRLHTVPRRSGRAGRRFEVPTLVGALGIVDPTPGLGLLLAIGQRTHVGKGIVEGFGRYVVG